MRSKKLLYLILYGISMAFVEAAVVIYLRELYYPENIRNIFPFKPIRSFDLKVELLRELSTLLMLWFVSGLAELKSFRRRFFVFLGLWGLWDIVYYLWLNIFIGWPASLLDVDVLFLIPVPWVAPVICPILYALVMTFCGLSVELTDREPIMDARFWLLVGSGAALGLAAFIMANSAIYRGGQMAFPWWIFIAGIVLFVAGMCRSAILLFKRTDKTDEQQDRAQV